MSAGLAFSALVTLAHACAPQVAPATLLSVAQAESGLDPLVIGLNGRPRAALHPATPQAAVQAAERLIAAGADVDLGLLQVNSRNLGPLGLSVADAFDPCRNMDAGARILARAYLASRPSSRPAQEALDAALSRYNTGDPFRGRVNGYVARVRRTADQVVPALRSLEREQDAPHVVSADPQPPVTVQPVSRGNSAASASVDVFARPAAALVDWTRPVSSALTETATTPSDPQGDPS